MHVTPFSAATIPSVPSGRSGLVGAGRRLDDSFVGVSADAMRATRRRSSRGRMFDLVVRTTEPD